MQGFDIAVVGGGIAGVSVAAELANEARVVLLERETTLAYHTTGRSAALFFGSYGHESIRALSRSSLEWFEDPPETDHPVLSPRGALIVEFDDSSPLPEGEGRIDAPAAVRLNPSLVPSRTRGAIWESDARDMDVAAIHQAFVKSLRSAGGTVVRSAGVNDLSRSGSSPWRISTEAGPFEADWIVNAAGAWGDELAKMAGTQPIGLVPKRRTVFMVEAPPASSGWPLVTDTDMTFYFKPDGIQMLCSPADETPSEPCDARPEEIDIARAIDRINSVTSLSIRSVRSSWAGLRTFAPDGGMVIGEDPHSERFLWLVGQGGTGIQTAPAAARLAAGLLLQARVPDDLAVQGVHSEDFTPARFAS